MQPRKNLDSWDCKLSCFMQFSIHYHILLIFDDLHFHNESHEAYDF